MKPAATKNFRFLIASDREGVLIASKIKDVSNLLRSSAWVAICLDFSSSKFSFALSFSILNEVLAFSREILWVVWAVFLAPRAPQRRPRAAPVFGAAPAV